MATSNTPPKPEDYGLTSDRVEWLSKHIPELESWEKKTKEFQGKSTIVKVFEGLVLGAIFGPMASCCMLPVLNEALDRAVLLVPVISVIVGAMCFYVGLKPKKTPPVEISADERDRFSNYQKALPESTS